LLRLGLAVAAVVFVLDRATKAWLLDVMRAHGPVVELTPFFNLVMVWNRGVSFGMLQSGETGRYLLSALALAIVAGLVVWLRRVDVWWLGAGLGGVIGGALGNVVDRLWYAEGAVADFFDFHVAGWHWPAFNVADAAIVSGVGLILLDALLVRGRGGEVEGPDTSGRKR
jgi:signal peptidase II